MITIKRTSVPAALALSVLFAWPHATYTLSCLRGLNYSETPTAYQNWLAAFNGVVFQGTVLSIGAADGGPLRVVLRVERAWKGVQASEIAIYTAREEGVGGRPFKVGGAYLVAAAPPDRPMTNTCSEAYFRTVDQDRFIRSLGTGAPPALQ